MVAAFPSSAATPARRNPKNPPDLRHHPVRPPLIPSEKDNAKEISSRRPRTKDISSRYLSSPSSSSSSSSSSSNSRRFPSPLPNPRPSTPSALPQTKQRAHSVDRSRPSTPNSSAKTVTTTTTTTTTTRSLSVSFQGESFFYQTSKAKASSSPTPNPNPNRKPSPERRRPVPPTPASRDQSENSKPFERWPAARAVGREHPNPLSRSLDCALDQKDPFLATVRLLQQSSVVSEDGTRRISFDRASPVGDSDTDSVSSGSNSGASDAHIPPRAKVVSRGISVPARFWQENSSRLWRAPEPGARSLGSPKMSLLKRNLAESPISSPRSSVGSPIRGPIRSSSPSRLAESPSRGAGVASPLRMRGNSGGMAGVFAALPVVQPGNAPSIISFAAEVRRAKKGDNRIEEAHMLRLLDNRHLQWRCVNARADVALDMQRLVAEKNLYNARVTASELQDSVALKRIKLQLLTQNLKLTSILKGQMTYLEELSHIDRDHSSSLSGAIEALKSSTLRLPVVCGAKADLQEVKDAVGSAVDVMQAMGSSICSLLSKVRKNLYWTPCAANCIDLMLKDIANDPHIKPLIRKSQDMTCFIYNHGWALSIMRTETQNEELVRPAIIRFATNFIAFDSILKHQVDLKRMINTRGWTDNYMRLNRKDREKADVVVSLIESQTYWRDIAGVTVIFRPLVKVLRMVDSDDKAEMGHLYEAMDSAKEMIKKNVGQGYRKWWEMIYRNSQLHRDIHAAGYFLNPKYQYSNDVINDDEVLNGFHRVVNRMVNDNTTCLNINKKVEGTSSLVSEIAKVAAQERALLDQSRDLLSSVAAMHVKQCSLHGHFLQVKCRPSQMQV